jgi:hypothetical protein
MGRTSTAVKRRYNDKTYTRWYADMRNAEYEELEKLRGDMSRPDFLRYLIKQAYGKDLAPSE